MSVAARGCRSFCATVGLRSLVVSSLWLASDRPAGAQAVQLQAGSSSLYDAHGVSIETRGQTATFVLGAGRVHDRFTIGALVRKTTRGVTLSVGDDSVDFQLPTDLFGGSHYLPTRGAGIDLVSGGLRVKGLVGSASTSTGAPFFRGAEWGEPLAMLFLDKAWTPQLRFVSRNAFAETHTSIHGVEWKPRKPLTLAAAGGAGGSEPYAAVSTTFENDWVSARAAQISGRSAFRHINLDSPASSETTGANLSVAVHPRDWWSVSAARQHLLDGRQGTSTIRAVTVNSAGLSVNRLGFRTGINAFESRGQQLNNVGVALSVARRISRWLDGGADFFHARSGDGSRSQNVVATLQETLTPRLSLLQVVTHSGNQTSMNVGGQFLSNPLTVAVTYQNVYAPFHESNPFVQALGVDLRLQVFDNLQLQAGTYTTPDGRLRYTISGTTIVAAPGRQGDTSDQVFRRRRYLIRGRVVDSQDQPLPGASLQVGEDVLMTDGQGRFFLRTESLAPRSLKVLVDEFMLPGRFEVVSAPTRVVPAPEDKVSEILIVMRRLQGPTVLNRSDALVDRLPKH